MKVIVRVPEDTIPYKNGERYMACELTDKYEYIRAYDFFKTVEDVKRYVDEHPEYKSGGKGGDNS